MTKIRENLFKYGMLAFMLVVVILIIVSAGRFYGELVRLRSQQDHNTEQIDKNKDDINEINKPCTFEDTGSNAGCNGSKDAGSGSSVPSTKSSGGSSSQQPQSAPNSTNNNTVNNPPANSGGGNNSGTQQPQIVIPCVNASIINTCSN